MRIRNLLRIPYTMAVLLPFLVFDGNGRSNNTKDETQVSRSNSVSAAQAQFNTYTYVISLSENQSFVRGVKDTVQALPGGVHKFIFEPDDKPGYKIFVWDKLLTDNFPQWEKELYYASGCNCADEKRIDMSTKVRRRSKNDAVEDYGFPKNNAYHELGHAFDNMLFELYFTGEVQETKDKYYSYHSGEFKDAYDADLKELKEKIKAGKIPKDEADRILRSYYLEETESISGKEETFAEIFCMIMLEFEADNSWKDDFKRILNFLSYYPRCKQVVLNQI